MYQTPSSFPVSSRGGVNRTTAVAVLFAVTLFSGLIFVMIAETVFPAPAMAQDPGLRERDHLTPSVLRPGDGAEIAAAEPVEAEELIPADTGDVAGLESSGAAEAVEPEPRRVHRPAGPRPAAAPRPTATEEGRPAPARPGAGSAGDVFGRDSEDPLGGLDFGPSIAG